MRTGRKVTLQFKDLEDKVINEVSFKVWDGLSAYEVWKALPGNEGKTEQEFIDSVNPHVYRSVTKSFNTANSPNVDLGVNFATEQFTVMVEITGGTGPQGLTVIPNDAFTYANGVITLNKEFVDLGLQGNLTVFGMALKG